MSSLHHFTIFRPISDDIPRALKSSHDIFSEENQPLKSDLADTQHLSGSITEVPTLAQFPAAMKRLFKNKLLMCNILSGIFYILGASAYFTFMSKYMEVQFHRSAADASIITGPVMIFGVVIGLLASGYVITKLKPSPSKLLMWNVIVGIGFMAGQVINLYLTCPGLISNLKSFFNVFKSLQSFRRSNANGNYKWKNQLDDSLQF